MSFGISWNLNKYKTECDTVEHWQWRRAFLIKNKNKNQENFIEILAQMFIKVKFYNWKYPDQTMDILKHFSDGLVVDWRDDSNDMAATQDKRISQSTSINYHQLFMKRTIEHLSPYDSDYILPGFIVLLGITDNPFEILERSCTFCEMEMPLFKYRRLYSENMVKASLYIQNILIASSFGSSRINAQRNVSKDAYYKLKRFCFVIKIKEDKIPINRINVYVNVNACHSDDSEQPQNFTASISTTDALTIFHEEYEKKLKNDNIENELLKIMGWQDSNGLEKAGQGRLDPIEAVPFPRDNDLDSSNGMFHLASSISNSQQIEFAIKKEIERQIYNFIMCPERVLKFATECTTNERRLIYITCKKFDLITRSYGDHQNRYVVVFKKENSQKLFQKLINNGLEDDYYELITPEKFK